jgi:hypothetical protein
MFTYYKVPTPFDEGKLYDKLYEMLITGVSQKYVSTICLFLLF